jgi:hypothetical protein
VGVGTTSCGSGSAEGFQSDGGDNPEAAAMSDAPTLGVPSLGDGGANPCVNLECQQVNCAAQGKSPTTITGTVVTGTTATYGTPDPVYNAIVYVPNAPVEPFAPGVSCDKCGTPVSGSPIVSALSDVAGRFTLTDAPSGTNIPLVIQIGRWRKQVVLPNVASCGETQVPADLARLPRNHTEGDIPHIAIATSIYDAEECILLKMGIDPAEFTAASGPGRVHLYHGTGATVAGITDMSALWADVGTLKHYDIVQVPCSSAPEGAPGGLGPAGQAMVDYAASGGRIFATDLSYVWYESAPGSWPQTVNWVPWSDVGAGPGAAPLPTIIDQSFPKGQALAQWLQGLGATTTLGQLPITDTYYVVDSVNPPATRWLYSTTPETR